MPQLDKVTFLSQFFWLCFFYLGFYFFIYKFFLPKMSRILKFRKKKIHFSRQGVSTTHQENEKVGESYETLLAKGFNASRSLFGDTSQSGTNWIKDVSYRLNQTHLQNLNKTYITTMGEYSAVEILTLQQSSFVPTNEPVTSAKSTKTSTFAKTQLTPICSLLMSKMQFFSVNAVKLAEPGNQFALHANLSQNKGSQTAGPLSTTNTALKKAGFTESTFSFEKKARSSKLNEKQTTK